MPAHFRGSQRHPTGKTTAVKDRTETWPYLHATIETVSEPREDEKEVHRIGHHQQVVWEITVVDGLHKVLGLDIGHEGLQALGQCCNLRVGDGLGADVWDLVLVKRLQLPWTALFRRIVQINPNNN